MNSIYTSGQYLESTESWHSEDSAWKAAQISKIIDTNKLEFSSVAEIGCGVGAILSELSNYFKDSAVSFSGFDISPQAIELAKKHETDNVKFKNEDILLEEFNQKFDILLMIDVFEHVPDYMGFLEESKDLAKYKVFHIPLDLHVSSVMRNSFIRGRYTIGHLHYFTAESALAALKDTGYEVKDYCYTNAAVDLFWTHPSLKKAVANIPRWVLSKINVSLSARILGGYSLLVLAE